MRLPPRPSERSISFRWHVQCAFSVHAKHTDIVCAINFKMKNLYAMRLCPILMSTIVNFCRNETATPSIAFGDVHACRMLCCRGEHEQRQRANTMTVDAKWAKKHGTVARRLDALYFCKQMNTTLFRVETRASWGVAQSFRIWHRPHCSAPLPNESSHENL